MAIVNIIGIFCVVVLVLIALWAVISIIKFFMLFHARHCKYCGHILEFKGYHEENKESCYEFHCPKCGAWEKVSRDEMLGENKSSLA